MSLIFTEMNRNNTSIYAVDPRGLAPFEYDINQGVGLQVDRKHLEMGLDTLRALAENTDGRAIVNRNDLGKGMQQIIRDASGYYLIGYNSSQAPTDGRFHKIDVEVTRKGVDVRARKGYWAYTAEDAARADAPRAEAPAAVTAALATLVDPPRGRPARFWIGTSRGENGKSKVTFAWEPIPPVPGERRPGEEGVSHVTLTALAPDGRPLFRGRVPEQSAAAPPPAPGHGSRRARRSTFRRDGCSCASRCRAPRPGHGFVDERRDGARLHDAASVVRDAAPLPRPNAARRPGDQGQSRARCRRAIARSLAPSGCSSAWTRTRPATAPPAVTARLLNRAGTAMFDVPVQVSDAGAAEMELAFASLAAGEYLLELNGQGGGRRRRRRSSRSG